MARLVLVRGMGVGLTNGKSQPVQTHGRGERLGTARVLPAAGPRLRTRAEEGFWMPPWGHALEGLPVDSLGR